MKTRLTRREFGTLTGAAAGVALVPSAAFLAAADGAPREVVHDFTVRLVMPKTVSGRARSIPAAGRRARHRALRRLASRSDGRIETKEQFIHAVMTRKQVVKSLAFPDLTVAVVGNAAIARHIYLSESERDGKATTTRIGALQVWQKQDGGWKLLARQGFRLPA
jgi:hypothetical protein